MNILILGGMNPRHKVWVRDVEKVLAPLFEQCIVHEYAHWNDPDKSMDIQAELAAVAEKTKDAGHYVIFAKSIGTVLTFEGIQAGVLHPQGCLLIGLPLGSIESEHIDAKTFAANTAPTIIVQHTGDPYGSFADVTAVLSGAPDNYRLKELPGDTHSYDELDQLKQLTASLL